MDQMDERHFRDLLLADQRATRELLAELDRSIATIVDARLDSNNDDEHDPEGATLAFERSQADALARQSTRRLADITDALLRLDNGDYGICAVCGLPISAARLEARPFARACINCA